MGDVNAAPLDFQARTAFFLPSTAILLGIVTAGGQFFSPAIWPVYVCHQDSPSQSRHLCTVGHPAQENGFRRCVTLGWDECPKLMAHP